MFRWGRPRRPKVIAFDVIGTVFPLEPLRPAVVGLGLPPAGLEAWFAAGLRDAFALSAAGDFEPFTTVLGGALDQVRAEQCLAPSVSARAGLMAQMKHLPARPDAREARRPRLGSNLAEPCRCRPPKPIWTLAKTRNRGKSRPTPKPAPAPEVIAWVNW